MASDLGKTNVSSNGKYIIRIYDGVRSVSDLAQMNRASAKEANMLVDRDRPVRILTDLRGNFEKTLEVYDEALKFLNSNKIEKIALLLSEDEILEVATQSLKESYSHIIEIKEFKSEAAAKQWLIED